LKTYPSVDWCGLILVYFHADGKDPEFEPPDFIPRAIKEERWVSHLQWNIGFKTLSPVDWVDQAGDHAHFHTLHGDFLLPWTRIPIPKWIFNLFPLGELFIEIASTPFKRLTNTSRSYYVQEFVIM
jgi:hypothetical protein